MESKPRHTKNAAAERRAGHDRRREEKGPPGRKERRVGIEPRRPVVDEIEVSPSDWAALQGLGEEKKKNS